MRYLTPLALAALLMPVTFGSAAPAAPPVTNAPSAEEIRSELTRAIPECPIVSENAARMLQQNPAATSTVVAEWHKFCGNSPAYFLYNLALRLNEIGPQSAEINAETWETLKTWSKTRPGMRRHPEMSGLLRKIATDAKPASEEGRLLKIWFVTGYTPFMRAVANAENSKLYPFYRQERRLVDQGMSLSFALNGTFWVPTGNLAKVGNHPGIGFQVHFGFENFYLGMNMDIRFSETPSPYNYYNENSATLEKNSQFLGFFFGPDFKWAFLNLGQLSVMAVAGLGYDMISHYSVPRYSRLRPAYSDSFNLNAGLGLRYYFYSEKDLYLETEVRIHRAAYGTAGTGGDDLSGHYFTAVATLGYKINFNEF